MSIFRNSRIETNSVLLKLHRRKAITLGDVVAIICALTLLVVLGRSLLSHRRGEVSTRLVCGAHLKGIGTTLKIYANDFGGRWAMPPFDETQTGNIDYRVPVGGGDGTPLSPNRLQQSHSGPGGARKLSTTRAFWMLVRRGDITEKQFVCPQSKDIEGRTTKIEQYYDFADYKNISYGFQVPFGPEWTWAHERMDSRVALAADKGPYIDSSVATPPNSLTLDPNSRPNGTNLPSPWAKYNSRGHGDGQNVLFADGHCEFRRTSTVGVDGDNIYTIALDNWNESSRVAGESPWMRAAPPYSPTATDGTPLASTDSVIIP